MVPHYRLTWPNLEWFTQDKLTSVLARFGECRGFNAHRRLALQQLLRLVHDIPGDTAECGVYEGLGSFIILDANARSHHKRTHHLFDSFEGLSDPSPLDGFYWSKGDLAANVETVKKNLAPYLDAVCFHPGWIPDRFSDVEESRFAFVHIDVDLYQPTFDSLQFFYDRLNPGGILVCDDYGFSTCPGATKAVDQFLQDKVEKMLFLPGGGGFFIKGTVTSDE